jgi:hypothetical protein
MGLTNYGKRLTNLENVSRFGYNSTFLVRFSALFLGASSENVYFCGVLFLLL